MARLGFVIICFLSAAALPLHGGIVVSQHSGAADPATEGWTTLGVGSNVTTGPVIIDNGFDAWNLSDQGTADSLAYRSVVPVASAQQALSQGFTERARLRVTNPSTPTRGSVALGFMTTVLAFVIDIGSEADSDPVLRLQNDSGTTTITAQGAGGGYHLYELIYSPVTQLADLRFDGQHLADYAGYHPVIVAAIPFNPSQVLWGSMSSNGTGAANYNLIQMEIVPEPATAALLAVFALAGFTSRQCR